MIVRPAIALMLVVGCGPAATDRAFDAGTDVGLDAPLVLDARWQNCERCHAAAARDHATTMHARAFDDPLFQREWSVRHLSSCVGCHAPLAEDASDPRAHEGVGCASCHVEDGAIVGAHASGDAPHPTRADEHFDDAERCGTCHEFDFVGHTPGHRPERLQRTLSEWRASGRTETCVDCHMAAGSHRLLGPRDDGVLASALDIDVSAARRGRSIVVSAVLRVADAGHAVPTGDLFRNLVFRATIGTARAEADMARLFDRDEDGERIEIADQRVLPGVERRIELFLPRSARRIDWALTWNALPATTPAIEGVDDAFRTREIASGTLRTP